MATAPKQGKKRTAPLLPPSKSNPVGRADLISAAARAVNGQIRRALAKAIKALLEAEKEGNGAQTLANASTYLYKIDLTRLLAIVRELATDIGDAGAARFQKTVEGAYRAGTAQAARNLSGLDDGYAAAETHILASRPVARRAAFAGARAFEEMKGFAGEAAKDLGAIIMRGVQDGKNPTRLVKELRERFDITKSRAERIARTEVTGALRRGRWDAADEARATYGLDTKMMHVSALSSTTRASHAARHGKLYTTQEVRDWYTKNGNGINCKCTQVEVLIKKDGTPLSGGLVDKLDKQRVSYEEKAK